MEVEHTASTEALAPVASNEAVTATEAAVVEQEEPASETIYINNLNEAVKIQNLKATLRNLFRNFGKVLDIVAHRNVRMRGQAFVSFETIESATRALKEANEFPLYGKPMHIKYAKTRSDAVVKRKAPDDFDTHKAERAKRKKISRHNNPLEKRKAVAKEVERKTTGALPAKKVAQAADEYLPPNKILFIQNLPDTVTKERLETMFKSYPGFMEVRTIPARKNIAFVEYGDEKASSTARDALHNTKYDGTKIKITFAKK